MLPGQCIDQNQQLQHCQLQADSSNKAQQLCQPAAGVPDKLSQRWDQVSQPVLSVAHQGMVVAHVGWAAAACMVVLQALCITATGVSCLILGQSLRFLPSYVLCLLMCNLMQDDQGIVTHYVGIQTDVTSLAGRLQQPGTIQEQQAAGNSMHSTFARRLHLSHKCLCLS